MNKKKIIHQLSLSDIGGVQRSFALYFPYALEKSNFCHYIYSNHDLLDNFDDIKKYHINIKKSPIHIIKLIFFLISKNYIIHFYNNLGSPYLNKLLNLFPSTNLIFHERGSIWNAKDKDLKVFRKNALKAKIIIANSNATKLMLSKRVGIPAKKIEVIYNGFFSKDESLKLKDNTRYSKRFSVGYIGRLDTPKGVHIIIQSAKILRDCDFFIAGQGILKNMLMKSAKNYKNIKFIGSTKQPLEFISKMDTIVVPSIREPLGNVVIEAGFCKKPVIASNIDGLAEIITNNINGILIDPSNNLSINKIPEKSVPIPEVVVNPKTKKLQTPKEIDPLDLCKIIRLFKNNKVIRQQYADKLNKSVKFKFNIETYFEKLENIYKKF